MPEFRSLASMLRAVAEPPCEPRPEVPESSAPPVQCEPDESALRDVRMFRAHLREALDRAVTALLPEIARDVLARELQLAPVDVARMVETALQRCSQCEPLRVRVHPDAVHTMEHLNVPVFCDEALERADACIDLRNGSIDLSLAVRLEDALGNALPHR